MKIRKSQSLFNSYAAIAFLILIWVFAFFLSLPLFLFSRISSINLEYDQPNQTFKLQHDFISPSLKSQEKFTQDIILYNFTT